ncbi:MAG: FTR1 family iron permease [Candidatus Omnitrophica bacterium]|nr:FTR1 family iron permease [Candidatus Omnitrophota bacterium]
MNEATVAATFLVVFREALEASLIVGIILTVLARLRAHRYFSHVFASVLAAILVSIGAGLWIMTLTQSAQGQMEKVIEGVISLVAASVLTYMVFWMDKQGRKIKSDIETKVEAALSRNDYFVMISLPFFAVFREGAETVLFLKAISLQGGGVVSFWGGLFGFSLAVTIAALLFFGGKKIPMRALFRGTGLLILVIAGGLLAYGVHELEEIGWINPIIYPIWNINPILNEKQGIGSFLKALFGYNGNPSLTEVIVYWSYLIGITFLLKERKIEDN